MLVWLAYYLMIGGLTGFLAGLLGIGGGLVMVPCILFSLAQQGYAGEYLMPLALGSSSAIIIFTALSSLRTHHAQGAVYWPQVRRFIPGVLLGTFLGTALVDHLPLSALKTFFALFVCFAAVSMWWQPAVWQRSTPVSTIEVWGGWSVLV